MTKKTQMRYCIFHDTDCNGPVPAYYSPQNGKDLPVTYATKREALEEITDDMLEHIAQIREGVRDLIDGIGYEDWIELVDVLEDGTVITESGNVFGERK